MLPLTAYFSKFCHQEISLLRIRYIVLMSNFASSSGHVMVVFIAENNELQRPLLLQYAMFHENPVKDVTHMTANSIFHNKK